MVERPQVKTRGVYATVIHAEAGRATITGTPYGWLSETPGKVYGAPPPTNLHYRPILKRVLGYSDQQIDELDAEGVFRT
jgi:crotonobetainyl-CoA:carnitine CoA-transferase CaiB-like acyl-CoA transferase